MLTFKNGPLGMPDTNIHTDIIAKKINDDILKKVFLGIENFYKFSQLNFSINKPSLYPYKLQTYAISYAFIIKPEIDHNLLIAWFHLSTYTGAFGATARNSSYALKDFINLINTGKLTWSLNIKPQIRIWAHNINVRSARMRAWSITLAKHQENLLEMKFWLSL